jgi:NADH-quinone oxidoreductase subunit H
MKIVAGLVIMIWIRASWPRFRYDQLMSFGWKVMLPIAVLNFVITAVFIVLYEEGYFQSVVSAIFG